MGVLRYIKDLLLRYKYRYILGVLFLLCVDTLQLVMPKVLEGAADALESGTLTRHRLAEYAVIIALIAVGIAVFRFLFRYTLYGVSRSIELSFRNRFYRHLQKLSANYFNTHKTGDLMAHATNDMNNVTMATGQGIIFAIDSFMIPVVSLVMMWKTAGFNLTAASFTPIFFLSMVIFYFMKIMQSTVQRQQEAFSNLTECARENFSGIRVVKSFAQGQKEIKRFENVNKINMQANLRFVRLISMMFPSVMLVSSLSYVVAIWYGGMLVIEGTLTLGGFVAFNSYLGMLIWPITALGWIANIFQRGSVSLKRINAIMDEKPEIADRHAAGEQSGESATAGAGDAGLLRETPASAVAWDKPFHGGAIEFKNLTFTYPGAARPALKDISVTVEKGKTLAIIGRAGSGKSTLVNLIPRLFQVPDGTLFIGGVNINDIPLSALRSSIACVPQDIFLFSDTIKNNIDFYRGFSMDEIENAAKIARLHDDIIEFPNKYETVVGERGVTLSGGQKQRVAIARAVLGAPSILILDDCLSAVDAKTEENILNDLKKLMKQRTSIIVSHRISAVKDADEIIVIDDGMIIERGTHSSLLELNGHYRGLYERQLLADEIEEVE
ncbi:MAG: ABC transporter ATP-binding protein [Bacillota bacterium]